MRFVKLVNGFFSGSPIDEGLNLNSNEGAVGNGKHLARTQTQKRATGTSHSGAFLNACKEVIDFRNSHDVSADLATTYSPAS